MKVNFKRIKRWIWLILIVEIVALIFNYWVLKMPFLAMETLIILMNIVLFVILLEFFEEQNRERLLSISDVLGQDGHEAFMFGEVGLLTIDSNYEITWVSELLSERNYDVIGLKIMNWLPETKALFNNEADTVEVTINDHIYTVRRKENGQTLYFKDITKLSQTSLSSDHKQIVLGLIHFDNLEETVQYEDERRLALIDSQIRQAVYNWANDHGIFITRLRNNRMLLVLNEYLFKQLVDEQFMILKTVRKAANELDVAISLSMAFARGSLEFPELEEMVNSALALAQSRGGDQVAIKTYGEDVVYRGGSVEAVEKRSKVRARVMAQTIKEIMSSASNVVIMGHKDMDFDCFGSALVLSRIIQTYQVPVSILLHGALEEKLANAYESYEDVLSENHHFIKEHEAEALLGSKSILVMVDHHQASQSTNPHLLDKAKRTIVIDHHRRNQDFSFNPVLVYMETAASSASEMVTELIPYQTESIELTEEEANFVLTGILIDTNRFRTRTGSRTFEVASLLKQYGADTAVCDDFLKDELKDFIMKTKIGSNLKQYEEGIVVASMPDNTILNRSLISQEANILLDVKDVEASFVVARIGDKEVGVSARSNGKINVHVIMERMNGGGHFTAAALQRENTSVHEVLVELDIVIEQWLMERE